MFGAIARLAIRFCIGVTLLVAACATTSIVSTWKEPGLGSQRFHNVLVVAPANDPRLRRRIEDELVRRIGPAYATASYSFFPESEPPDRNVIRERAQAYGFDGILVFRVASVEKRGIWVPGSYAGPTYAFGG